MLDRVARLAVVDDMVLPQVQGPLLLQVLEAVVPSRAPDPHWWPHCRFQWEYRRKDDSVVFREAPRWEQQPRKTDRFHT
jgi:hypothetical protein